MTHLRNILLATILIFSLFFQNGCRAERDLSELTEGEAVEIIESALQSFAGGLTSNVQDITEQLVIAVTTGELCDTLYTRSIEENYQRGQVQSSYNTELKYQMSCNQFEKAQSATFTSSTTYDYSTLRLDSDDKASFDGSISGLLISESNLLMEGDYESTGTQELNFNTARSIGSTFSAVLSNLQVSKSSFEITTGTGTFSFTGSTTDASFTYTGSITFNGDDTLTLTLNGTDYPINLN